MTSDEIIVAIVASLIAAVIFWIVFNYIPNRYDKKRVKPMIDFDLYQIYYDIAFYLETPFRQFLTSAMYNQHLLYEGQLKQEDFKIFLSTKCLNAEYQSIDEMAKQLLPIGDTLKKYAQDILGMIQRTYVFNKYLTAEQILLCRKIADKISTYNYELKAYEKVGNELLHPVDPTLKYMSRNFFEIYQLFLQLQNMLIKQTSESKEFGNIHIDLVRREMGLLYSQEQYNNVVKRTRRSKDGYMQTLCFRSLIHLGKTEDGLKRLSYYLKEEKEKLIYLRGTFFEFVDNPTVVNVLIQIRTKDEYQEMVDCLDRENEQYEQYRNHALQLYEYYVRKVRDHIM